MKVNNVFHVQLVRRWDNNGIPGQQNAEGEVNANRGRVMVRTDDHDDAVVPEWSFDAVLDYGQAANGRWQYLVKWSDHEPSWQPIADLKGYDHILWAFHNANPDKGKPPAWLKKPRASHTSNDAAEPTAAADPAMPLTTAMPAASANAANAAPPQPVRRSARTQPRRMDAFQLRTQLRCVRNFGGTEGSVTGFACTLDSHVVT